ncbi:hypothetical protein ACP81S_12550, partial [Escherichia coli]
EKVQKIAAGEEGNYRMERVPLKQTDRHHKSPGGDLCIRDSLLPGALTKGKMTINHHFPRKRFRGDNKSWQLPAFVQ